MAISIRKTGKRVLKIITVITVFLFLLSCLAPFTDPQKSWVIALLGLGFPVLLIIVILLLVFWTVLRKKLAWLCLISLLLGWKSIRVTFALNVPKQFSKTKSRHTVRLASWNVARFIEWKRNNNKGSRRRLKILEQIRTENPDILCLQEFFHSPDTVYYNNIEEIQAMGYPYFYFSYDPDGWRQYIGSVIFSKYPVIDSGMVRYFRPSMPEALIYADIKIGNDTIRVFTTHLQSVQFRKSDYQAMSEIASGEDSLFTNTRSVLSKIKKAIRYRSTQAKVVRDILEDSPYPKIMCGDFNDIPNSFTYFRIKSDMKDVFLEKGLGMGRTFSSLSSSLRIDYIFTGDNFTVQQFRRFINDHSDHYMLMTDLKLQPEK